MGQNRNGHLILGLMIIATTIVIAIITDNHRYRMLCLVGVCVGLFWAEIPGHLHLLPRLAYWWKTKHRK